ncbi:hypothetical protein TcWFU_003728 [Taenia crassiceps]|uniref:BTB domain-containing protein n=1 Tax=Taenia crassiceps TaxID=6207 RepID=A0ABR4QGQ6_9CEST
MDKALCDFLSGMQSRLFDFYKEGKLTDVTWIVGVEGGEEECVSAHSSICALSSRLKELMLAHSQGKVKNRIRIPPSLTSSPSDLRSLLHLAYTGSFEEGRSLDEYFSLCELFDMPIGIDVCLRGLNNLLAELLFRRSVDNETQNGLRDFFVHSLDNSKMKSVHRVMLDFFRMYPLIFDTELCLSKVPVEWVMELLGRGELWMQHPDGFVYFGEKYMSEATQLLFMFRPSYRLPSATMPRMPTTTSEGSIERMTITHQMNGRSQPSPATSQKTGTVDTWWQGLMSPTGIWRQEQKRPWNGGATTKNTTQYCVCPRGRRYNWFRDQPRMAN